MTPRLSLRERQTSTVPESAAYLTGTEEKKVRVCSELLSLNVTVRVSLTFLRSDLERLVLSFSRAETCLTLK